MNDLDRLSAATDLPDGAIPTEAVLVIGYLDSDGGMAFHVKTGGTTSVSTVIGLMTMAQHEILIQNDHNS